LAIWKYTRQGLKVRLREMMSSSIGFWMSIRSSIWRTKYQHTTMNGRALIPSCYVRCMMTLVLHRIMRVSYLGLVIHRITWCGRILIIKLSLSFLERKLRVNSILQMYNSIVRLCNQFKYARKLHQEELRLMLMMQSSNILIHLQVMKTSAVTWKNNYRNLTQKSCTE